MSASKSAVRRQLRLFLGIAALACLVGAGDAAAARSEFERLHAAVVSRDREAALAFINGFPSSDLIDDLIVMLPAEVAQAVCADLPSGANRAQAACRKAHMRVGMRDLWGETILADDADGGLEPMRLAAGDAADAGMGDSAISPAAGPHEGPQALASARSRRAGTTGERTAKATAMVLMARLGDSAAAPADDKPATAARAEAAEAPTPQRATAHPLSAGSDPGSDLGTASPSSAGKDPGSDPGSAAGGGGERDSHN